MHIWELGETRRNRLLAEELQRIWEEFFKAPVNHSKAFNQEQSLVQQQKATVVKAFQWQSLKTIAAPTC